MYICLMIIGIDCYLLYSYFQNTYFVFMAIILPCLYFPVLRAPESVKNYLKGSFLVFIILVHWYFSRSKGSYGILCGSVFSLHLIALLSQFDILFSIGESKGRNLRLRLNISWLYSVSFYAGLFNLFLTFQSRVPGNAPEWLSVLIGLVYGILLFVFWEYTREFNGATSYTNYPTEIQFYKPLFVRLGVAFFFCILISSVMERPVATYMIELKEKFQGGPPPEPENPVADNKRQNSSAGFSGGNISLPNRMNLKLKHVPVGFVKVLSDKSGTAGQKDIYLRGAAFSYFSGREWAANIDRSTWVNDEDDGKKDGVITLGKSTRNQMVCQIYLLKEMHRTVLAVPQLQQISMPRISRESLDWYVFPGSGADKITYRTISSVQHFDRLPANAVISVPSNDYLTIPKGDLYNRIGALASQIVGEEISDLKKVKVLQEYLRKNIKYSLRFDNPDNRHPLDNFLFYEKKGYCAQFASAFAVMLRSQGIPSRVCAGYAGGVYDSVEDYYGIFSDHAHSWTEVYFRDYGWVVVDATAPMLQNMRSKIPDRTKFPGEDQFTDIGELDNIIQQKSWMADLKKYMTPFNLMIMIFVLFVISWVFPFFKPGFEKEIMQADGLVQDIKVSPNFKDGFYRVASMFGIKKAPGQTLKETVYRLKSKGVVEDELDEMVDYFYGYMYAGEEKDEAVERRILSEIESLKVKAEKESSV